MGWKEEKLIKNKGEKNLRRQGAGKTIPCLSARNSFSGLGRGIVESAPKWALLIFVDFDKIK
jgi:hypothetical protein